MVFSISHFVKLSTALEHEWVVANLSELGVMDLLLQGQEQAPTMQLHGF